MDEGTQQQAGAAGGDEPAREVALQARQPIGQKSNPALMVAAGAGYALGLWVILPTEWVPWGGALTAFILIVTGLAACGEFWPLRKAGRSSQQTRRGFIATAFLIWGVLMMAASFLSILPKCDATLVDYSLIDRKKGIPESLLIYDFKCPHDRTIWRGFTFMRKAPDDLRGRMERMKDAGVTVSIWTAEQERRVFFPLGDEWLPMSPAEWRRRGFFRGYADIGTGLIMAGVFMAGAAFLRNPKDRADHLV